MSETELSDSPEMPEGQFDFDPAGPQAIYDLMREHSPVLRTDQGGTIIAGHEDVEFALRNADSSSRSRSIRPSTSSTGGCSTRCSPRGRSRCSRPTSAS